MKEMNAYTKWTLHHTWVVTASYLISMIVLLLIHGAFGFSMKEDGTYLSNTLMHLGSGIVLALGTGLLQRELLKKYFLVSFSWVWSLIAGFVLAELIAGVVLWKLEVYRGLINLFNANNHFPEAAIFALAGLIAGILQCRLLSGYYKNRFYWIAPGTLGWGVFILSAYLGVYVIIAGALFYGAITGFVLNRILKSKNQK
ncbi:MAG: hypothetical protein IPM85_01890 [Chitinophagaceae bacterium]|nr:hypothetical protein [Chitinophagaceae bacterium]